jgi:outer membrane protein TolC
MEAELGVAIARAGRRSILAGALLITAGCAGSRTAVPVEELLVPGSFVQHEALDIELLSQDGTSGASEESEVKDEEISAESAAGVPSLPAGREPLLLDLQQALEIGAQNGLRIGLARERLAEAQAFQDEAESLWLPDLWAGFGYSKHEGATQATEGNILRASSNSGFIGAGLVASFDPGNAILGPRAAEHRVASASAGVSSSVNGTLLDVALAYSVLLEAQAHLELANEVAGSAGDLVQLAESFSSSGRGLESDAARARNELAYRRRKSVAAEQLVATRSARLATLLRLDPTLPLLANQRVLLPIELLPLELELTQLVEVAIDSRPEVRALAALVAAEEEDTRREELAPLIPHFELGVRGGGFGGGTGSEFGDFSEDGELTAALVWRVRNLGSGEAAIRDRHQARTRRAKIELQLVRDKVAEQVTVAYFQVREGRRQIDLAALNVEESQRSLELNLSRLRGSEGLPIESLQATQAWAAAKESYVSSVGEFNRSQFRLLHSIGSETTPLLAERR